MNHRYNLQYFIIQAIVCCWVFLLTLFLIHYCIQCHRLDLMVSGFSKNHWLLKMFTHCLTETDSSIKKSILNHISVGCLVANPVVNHYKFISYNGTNMKVTKEVQDFKKA